jgi:hypothetical protein
MDSVSPVWTEKEVEIERVIALDQPEYSPLIGLPVRFSDNTSGMSVRFRLTDDERKAIADGADFLITEMTYGMPMVPIHVCVCAPNKAPFDILEGES